jgi:hypothetical protein
MRHDTKPVKLNGTPQVVTGCDQAETEHFLLKLIQE